MKKYYYLEGENRKGPFTKEELSEISSVTDETLIWYDGLEDWASYTVVFNEKTPPPPPSNLKTTKPAVGLKLSKKLITRIGITILAVSVVVFGFFYYRSSLIEEALTKFKNTGKFNNESLIKAKELGSDFAGALLAESYHNDDDTIQSNEILNELKETSDWRVIAIRNFCLNEANQIVNVKKGIEEEVANNNWYWLHHKAVFILNNSNDFKYDKTIFLKTEKKAADLGCVSAMRIYATYTDEVKEKCHYFKKVIDSKYENLDLLGDVYFNMAVLSQDENGCKKDDNLLFKYSTKASKLGHNGGYYLLGICYLKGKGTTIDYKKSFDSYSKASELGFDSLHNGEASFAVAQLYQFGKGVTADQAKYKENLNIAAKFGNHYAIEEKEANQKREAIIKARSASGNGIRTCKCCGNQYNPSYGWGYDSEGPFRKGQYRDSDIYTSFVLSLGFKSTDPIKYCSKDCAWDCQ